MLKEILVIDDNPDIRLLVSNIFGQMCLFVNIMYAGRKQTQRTTDELWTK